MHHRRRLDNFRVVIKDDAWLPERYRIAVTYAKRGDAGLLNAYVCDVRVPSYSWSGALDGSVAIVEGDDGGAGIDTRNARPCRILTGFIEANAAPPTVRIGRALELSFPGTPATAKLGISTASGLLLERELQLSYRVIDAECDGPTAAKVEIELP